MEISDPNSDKYGQHMSAKEVGELFRPSSESIELVRQWVHSSGIDIERHQVSPGRGWLKFDATIKELESLLSTEYHIYHHIGTKEDHIGCDDYHVPRVIHPHIDFISPTVSTIQIKSQDTKHKRRSVTKSFSPAALPPYVKPADISMGPKADIEIPCYTAVTPDCIRQLYGIPMGNSNQTGNEIGIFEDGDFYDQTDLDLTFAVIAPYVPNGTHPILEGIDGGTAPEYVDGILQVGVESLLDMSIIFPLIHPQQAILFQVDDLKEVESTEGLGDTFLDALDASYCTFEGGDDPTVDPHYPDNALNPANESYLLNGTWGKPEMCGTYKPTNVISVSYGLGENTFSFFYENRQCQEVGFPDSVVLRPIGIRITQNFQTVKAQILPIIRLRCSNA
jgi:tripeptidyl-peptidase-1